VREAFVLVSFGGPEGPDDVMPFLRNVTAGRGIPEDRLAAVAQHYQHFGGVSPINAQNRALLDAVEKDLAADGLALPVYWGNRNWHPMLADTVARMRDDGIEHAYAFVTSAYGSYSACRQYLDDLGRARAAVPGAPVIEKLRHFHDDPGFVEPHADAVRASLAEVGGDARIVFTAHSIPSAMAASAGPSGGLYEAQLRETARLVAERVAPGAEWDLVWQSRSGSPRTPWLEPDINDHLAALAQRGVTGVVVSPIGFVSDHLEVIWDLDNEAATAAERLGLRYARAATPGTDPRFVSMITRLVRERMTPSAERRPVGLGTLSHWDACPKKCCGAE
jgi:ferrochelatase